MMNVGVSFVAGQTRQMSSPCGHTNQPSCSAIHVRQPSDMSLSPAGVARPNSTACPASDDETTRSAHVEPHHSRRSGLAKSHASTVAVTSLSPASRAHLTKKRPASGSAPLAFATWRYIPTSRRPSEASAAPSACRRSRRRGPPRFRRGVRRASSLAMQPQGR